MKAKHTRFEEGASSLVDERYSGGDRAADDGKGGGIARHFADTLEYDERKKWYHQLPQEPLPTKTLTEEQIAEMLKEASSALHGDTLAYENKASKSNSSDQQWARTLMHKGAIGDRVAAATILIQDSPLHNLSALRNLINSVKPAKKKDGIVVIDAVSELFVSELLVPEVKLRKFSQHALAHVDEMTSGNKHARKGVLKLWYYEEQLEGLYTEYVQALNLFAHDSVDANKEKSVSAMSYLLMHHPEKEKILLKNIINKLGDPSQTVASKVTYHLCQLLYNHPNMKSVVLAEIEKMLFRTNISPRAQYYGVCFLNQFYLGKDDAKIAESLIKIYFAFFKASIKKGEIDSRLMSAILTGVKRAYPFADKLRLLEAAQHIDAVHRIVHLGKFNIAVHALALLYHISDASAGSADRFYTALYRKLTNAEIFNTTQSALLFSLLYKSLRSDKNVPRVTAFVKRLVSLSCHMNPASACALLLLISQVVKDRDKKDAIKLAWSPEELKEEKAAADSLELEDDENDVEDAEATQSEEFKEEEKRPESQRVDLLKGSKMDLLDDDDEESYPDLKLDESGNVKPKRKRPSHVQPGWFHLGLKTEPEVDSKEDVKVKEDLKVKVMDAKILLKKTVNMDKVIRSYDPYARNPAYSGAERAALCELLPLCTHFHPSVRLFAHKILHGQIIQYSGDPLKDFSGIRFLDRFAFKNPKRRSELEQEDGQAKKVKGSHPKFALRRNYTARGLKGLPVNSSSYLNEDAHKIPVDERFLYDYLLKRRTADESDEDGDSDAASVTSEDFDQYLDKLTGAKADEESEAEAEDLDFLADVQDTLRRRGDKRGKGKAAEEEHASEDEAADLDGSDDDSDGDLDIAGDEEEGSALSADEDELMLDESDEEEQIDVPGDRPSKKKSLRAVKGKDDMSSLFASAEEFSTLLEDTAAVKQQGSSQAVSTTDNADHKQLAWEDKRDHWIKGYNRKVHGVKGKGKKKNFSNKSNSEGGKKSFEKGNTKSDKGGGKRRHDSAGAGGKKKKTR